MERARGRRLRGLGMLSHEEFFSHTFNPSWNAVLDFEKLRLRSLAPDSDHTPINNNAYQTPIRHPSDTYQTPIRRLSDTYQTPIRHLSDTYQTPIFYDKEEKIVSQEFLNNKYLLNRGSCFHC